MRKQQSTASTSTTILDPAQVERLEEKTKEDEIVPAYNEDDEDEDEEEDEEDMIGSVSLQATGVNQRSRSASVGVVLVGLAE